MAGGASIRSAAVDASPAAHALRPRKVPAHLEGEERAQALRRLLHDVEDEDVWVFGYGSLLWNPGFDFEATLPARLYGYHRAFCIRSEYYRGTVERPGLVLGLDRGGSCQGRAFLLPRGEVHAILDYLWDREMVTSVYEPRVVVAASARGRLGCRTFVAYRGHEQYAGRLGTDAIVRMIRQGMGRTGSNVEYLANTVAHLDELGIIDGHLHRLLTVVRSSSDNR